MPNEKNRKRRRPGISGHRTGQRPRPRRIQTRHLPAGSSRPARHADAARTANTTGEIIVKSRIPFIYHRAGIFTAIALSWMSCANASDWAGMTANEVTTCEYDSKNFTLMVAQIHAAKLYADYERHGFFRIGLLPIPVAEDVQIKIRSADCLTNALSSLHFWNEPSLAVRRFELRNIEIKSFDEKQPRLSASLAHIGQNGVLELTTVSVFNDMGQRTSFPKAVLQVAGSSAGWLRGNSDGHSQELFLFKPTSVKTP